MLKVYQGKICEFQNEDYNFDTDKYLYLENDNRKHLHSWLPYPPLLEHITEDINEYGNYLSVKYWISEKELSLEEVKEEWIKKLLGISSAEFHQVYGSEWTGWMWTDQKLQVGGHNLLEELESFVGKYLYLEIEFSKELNAK